MAVLLAAFLLASATQRDTPPPILDPVPGPFIVGFDPDGALTGDAEGIIAHAARSWLMHPRHVFTACFQPDADARAMRSGFTALQAVAARLKAHGAGIVVTTSGGRCSPDWSVAEAPSAYVYIMGSVRL